MKYKLVAIFLLYSLAFPRYGSSQMQGKSLNFVFLIDNDIPTPSLISEGFFVIIDSSASTHDSIPFKYNVGNLILSEEDFSKLFLVKKAAILLCFKYFESTKDVSNIRHFRHRLPSEAINNSYTILKIHNYSVSESRKPYTTNCDGFGLQIIYPGGGIVSAKINHEL